MKTITINIAKEMKIWLITFLFTCVLNCISILIYKTEWKELYTQLGFVFMLSCFFYLLVSIVRFVIGLFRRR